MRDNFHYTTLPSHYILKRIQSYTMAKIFNTVDVGFTTKFRKCPEFIFTKDIF